MDNAQVHKTSNYELFKFLGANRELGKGHVERLKKAFEERGNLTQVQPLLVNENMEIIDGQHRFLAAKELGEPIYYMVYPGLGISDARTMNIMHKEWRTDDYAKSYADSGDASYRRYLQLREEFGATHSTILAVTTEGLGKGAFSAFRNGEYVLTPEGYEEAKEALGNLTQLEELVPSITNRKEFDLAAIKSMRMPDYDQARMVKKLSQVGSSIPSYSSSLDYQRALEDAYNRHVTEENRVRLF
jgi:hypothetical protein